jgi:hypothetical protein
MRYRDLSRQARDKLSKEKEPLNQTIIFSQDRDLGQPDPNKTPGVETPMRVRCGGKGGVGGLCTPPYINSEPPLREGGDR